MKCQICPATLDDGPLYRANAKGVPGIWRCEKHVGGNPPNAEVKEISELLHTGLNHLGDAP